MIDRFRIVMPLIILGALLFSCQKVNRASVETFQTDSGWGYCVKHNGQTFIKQANIPAVTGNYSFVREVDARNTGRLILQKLKNKQSPAITVQELDSLKIEIPPRSNIR